MDERELPLEKHLEELRSCLIKALIGIIIGFTLCSIYSEEILSFLTQPLFEVLPPEQRKLFFTSPMEKLNVYIKIGVAGGLALASPWILWQIWRFLAPGLYLKEKKFAGPVIFGGAILFFLGCTLSFYVVVPKGLAYLITLGGSPDGAIITYTSYFNVLLVFMGLFGLVFQTPLLITLAVFMNLVDIQKLKKIRPHTYVVIAVLSGVLTPPDPFSMLAMFIPTVLLYELTLLFLSWKK